MQEIPCSGEPRITSVDRHLRDRSSLPQAFRVLLNFMRAPCVHLLASEQRERRIGNEPVGSFGSRALRPCYGTTVVASASMEQERRAMCHALSGAEHQGLGSLPTGICTIPEIATVGLSQRQAIEKCGTPMVARVDYGRIGRAHIMASPSGMLKIVANADGKKLLGVQFAGDGATELIHMGQIAIIGHMTVDTFAHATFNFPTMADAYRLAALEIVHARNLSHSMNSGSRRQGATMQPVGS